MTYRYARTRPRIRPISSFDKCCNTCRMGQSVASGNGSEVMSMQSKIDAFVCVQALVTRDQRGNDVDADVALDQRSDPLPRTKSPQPRSTTRRTSCVLTKAAT